MEKSTGSSKQATLAPTEESSDVTTYRFPFATAPDIVRSTQKDAYFQGVVHDRLSDILRQVYGARFLHNHATAMRTWSDSLYLGLTTLLGNRTLGEEYCDLLQVEDGSLRMPSLHRRAGYILATVIVPYFLSRFLPVFRRRIRSKLEADLRRRSNTKNLDPIQLAQPRTSTRIKAYILAHLDTLTSLSPLYAVNLALFYFTGAYQELGKRLFGLRYIFTRTLLEEEQRAGYEVLGSLLVLQMVLQGWLHIRQQIKDGAGGSFSIPEKSSSAVMDARDGTVGPFSHDAMPTSPHVLLDTNLGAELHSSTMIEKITHTPIPPTPRYDLHGEENMQWIHGRQQRKCTLCLEPMKEPSTTTCGHVFCWTCINSWCREKPECPLCRQTSLPQHILPLRG
ncbi:MAG: MutS protein msh4 [Watsoniomyces obsoletus]|nr:MAG: MutS protein msh4 [Watsoniomyces obsoletus]